MTHLSMSGSGFAQDSRRNQLRQFAAAAAEAGGNAVAALTNVASGALQSIAPSPQDVAMTDQAVTPPMALRQPALDVARASAITPPVRHPHCTALLFYHWRDVRHAAIILSVATALLHTRATHAAAAEVRTIHGHPWATICVFRRTCIHMRRAQGFKWIDETPLESSCLPA